MKPLTRKEEALMQVLWRLERAFVKDIIEELPEPRPHYNTVSTVIRKLEEKGYVGHEDFGPTYRYHPLIPRDDYRRQGLKAFLADYFDNSYKEVVAFFAREEKLSKEDLREILEMMERGRAGDGETENGRTGRKEDGRREGREEE